MGWNIEPKFERGQKVWLGYAECQTKRAKCPTCLGTGEWTVTAPSGELTVLQCDKCQYGSIIEGYPYIPFVRELTIGTLRVDTHEKEPVSYMCEETGIGSGQIHRESTLRATEAEAWIDAHLRAAESEKVREQRHKEIDENNQRRARRSASKAAKKQAEIAELKTQLERAKNE